jgi:glycosyltransferase involved in cell wall biosynthesis
MEMKLLIVTQKVDLEDPILGFFHAWLVEFSKHVEKILVICLEEGEHNLSKNVSVFSLGKEKNKMHDPGFRIQDKLKYIWHFYRYILKCRHNYDTVFVHMNQEYVLLAGLLWRLLGKRVVLWRNHKTGNFLTRIASRFAHFVCYTSPVAYVGEFKNSVQMPIGIDTARFISPDKSPSPKTILFLGRLDPVKRPETFISALKRCAEQGAVFYANVYGDPTHPDASDAVLLKKEAESLRERGMLVFHPSVRNEDTPAIYRAHAIYVNLTPSGSFDKTIGEAMASGCVIVAANEAVREVLSDALIPSDDSVEAVAECVRYALSLPEHDRQKITRESRLYVEKEHSLVLLVDRLFGILKA